MSRPSVAVIGAGLLGLTVAHRLLEQGVEVSIYERSDDLGGLVGTFDFDGYPADRFYHVVLPTDDRVRALARELGLDDFRFRPVQVGFYDSDRLFSMSSLREFMTFPLLSTSERIRLAAFVAGCRRIEGHEDLDSVPLDSWLRRRSGHGVYERLWQPLLDSKFDGCFSDLPATYMWARTRRMAGTRDAAGREIMGWPRGGYQSIVDALAASIRARGGEIHTGSEVHWIVGDEDRLHGIVVDGGMRAFDHVVSTLLPPQNARLLSPELARRAPMDHCRYLGVVCAVLRTRRSISPYYTLNIPDRSVPLTTIVETTHVVDPATAGGHLVYVAKYVKPGHPDLTRPAEEVARDYQGHVKTIFPDFAPEDVLAVRVQRTPIVEPVHVLGAAGRLPDMFPLNGLTLASTVHVYPAVVNGQALIGVADRAAAGTLARLGSSLRAAA